jgi:hypothetical protein
LVAFVGVGQVASAFVGDGFFAVLGAGLLAARHLQAAHGVVEKLDGAIDDRRCGRPGHKVGNYNRLPGWVVYFCPLGEIQSTVPSGCCWSRQPQNVLKR